MGGRVQIASPTHAEHHVDTPKVVAEKSELDFLTYPDTERSLLCLHPDNKFRVGVLRIISNTKFQGFILVCIVVNSILLAVDQPKFTNPKELDDFLLAMEVIFLMVFVVEMTLKVIALGFIAHPFAYLRSGWNVLDFIIVVSGIVSLSGSIGNFSALRVIRVLRPLRSVSRVKKLRMLIGGLFKALPMVLDNVIFLAFIVVIFAIAAVQFWVGKLNQRCYVRFDENSSDIVRNMSSPFILQTPEQPCGGLYTCPVVNDTGVPIQSFCEVHENIYFERFMNYNNIGTASFLLLKVIVLDNWPDNLSDAMHVSGRYSAGIFFILITLVASYFCVNLFLAILTLGYTTNAHEDKELSEHTLQMVHRDRASTQNVVTEYMDCGVQCDVESDVLSRVRKAGYIDDEFRQRRYGDAQCSSIMNEASPRHSKATPSDGSRRRASVSETYSASPFKPRRRSSVSRISDAGLINASTSGPSRQRRRVTFVTQQPEEDSLGRQIEQPMASPTNGSPTNSALRGRSNPKARKDSSSGSYGTSSSSSPSRSILTMQTPSPTMRSPESSGQFNPTDDSGFSNIVTTPNDRSSRGPLEPDLDPNMLASPTVPAAPMASPQARRGRRRRSSAGPSTDTNGSAASDQLDVTEQEQGIYASPLMPADAGVGPKTHMPPKDESIFEFVFDREESDISIGAAQAPMSSITSDVFHIDPALDSLSDNDDENMDEEDKQDRQTEQNFRHTLEVEGIISALAALEQTMINLDPSETAGRAKWRVKLGEMVESKPIGLLLFVVSIVNVVVLSVDYYGIDPELARAMNATSVACTTAFAVQLLFKVIAWGPRLTFSKVLNVFDLIMVALAIPDIIFSGGGQSAFSVIRAFRMVRVVRILRNFQSLQAITETILQSWSSVGYLSLLLLLCLYIYAIMGMQLYGLGYGRGTDARENFGSLWEALLLCFIVVSGDNWTDMMVLSMKSGKEEEITSIFYFTSLYMIGNYILINLFVAIIIDKLSQKMEELEEKDYIAPTLILPVVNPNKEILLGTTAMSTAMANSNAVPKFAGTMASTMILGNSDEHGNSASLGGGGGFLDEVDTHQSSCGYRMAIFKRYILFVKPIKVVEDSLFLFAPQNKFRRFLLLVLGSRLFDWFITANVFASMVFLCFEASDNSESTNLLLDRANNFFTGIFCLEMCIKIIAFGGVYPATETDPSVTEPHQAAYFRDAWNWVDTIINFFSLLALRYSIFKSSRSLRTIRLTIRTEKTKLIIVAMLQAIPHVLQGLMFVIFLFYVLGIMGVQLFKGEYYKCSDESIEFFDDCKGNYTVNVQGPILLKPEVRQRQWERLPYHFDHLGASVLALFVVSVGDGWSTIMFQGMDTTRPERGPKKNNEPWIALFFIIVFICCNFFAFNMIIGILINYFSKMKKRNDGSALLTADQRLYVKARFTIDSIMFSDDLIAMDYSVSQKIGKMLKWRPKGAESNSLPRFELVMLGVIVVNAAVIASTHKDMAEWEIQMHIIVNYLALAIFAFEMFLKITAFGLRQYLSSAWNRFDASIVILGYLALILDYNFLSFIRVLRVIKLVRRSAIERLLGNVVRSLNSFINVLALVILTFFIYAVAGVILWGNVKRNGSLSDTHNFDNVPNAMLLLYQVATTEGWAEYMTACSIDVPNCDPDPPNGPDNCGNQAASTAFFVTFMVVCAFTILQLFVAVVVEIFTDEQNWDDPVVQGFLELKEIWTTELGAGITIISLEQFVELLPVFPAILTDINRNHNHGDIIRLLACLQIPIDSKYRVTYRDIVHALAWRKYHIDIRSIGTRLNDAIFDMIDHALFLSFTAAEGYAAVLIQQRWRRYRTQQHEQNMVLYRMGHNRRASIGGNGAPAYTMPQEVSKNADTWYNSEFGSVMNPHAMMMSDTSLEPSTTQQPGRSGEEEEANRARTAGALFAPQPMFLHFDNEEEPPSSSQPSKMAGNPFAHQPMVIGDEDDGAEDDDSTEDEEPQRRRRSHYGLERSSRRRRRSSVAVAAELAEARARSDTTLKREASSVAPRGAVTVPGCNLYSFVPLSDQQPEDEGGLVPDRTGLFNPDDL